MPRLLIFAPCEKVILDQYGNPSLIAVIQEIVSPLSPDAQLPQNVLGMMRWDVFTLWQREPGDGDKEFIQDCALIGPGQKASIQASMTFKVGGKAQRNIMSLYGFPLASPGEHQLRLWLRESTASEEDRKEIASFPLTVNLKGK